MENNEKNGKRSGKLNIIDLLVIIIAAVIVAAVGWKLMGSPGGNASHSAGAGVTYTVQVAEVEPEVYEEIRSFIDAAQADGQPGDQLMASGELVDGYVLDVQASPHVSYNMDAQGQTVVSQEENGRVDLVFTIQAAVGQDISTKVGTQEVRVGRTHVVKTIHFELSDGVILTCRWEGGAGADG